MKTLGDRREILAFILASRNKKAVQPKLKFAVRLVCVLVLGTSARPLRKKTRHGSLVFFFLKQQKSVF